MDRMVFCTYFEPLVVFLQVAGVACLCLHRLLPERRWGKRLRILVLLAVVGLGLSGAVVGRHDSEFALFAGGTMTMLLIGMITGTGHVDRTQPPGVHAGLEGLGELLS
jgi:hypothetical protein